jgi:histidine triad (HIT) family protein
LRKILNKKAFNVAKSPIGKLIVGAVFGRFATRLPIKKVFENNKVIAFWHPKPYWEKHILIVPKKRIAKLTSVKPEEAEYVYWVFAAAIEILQKLGWEKEGYSITINGGPRQEVAQLHFHLHSGKVIKN